MATPIDYIVEDTLGQIAQGTITPTVNKPTPPTADPQTKSVLPGDTVSFTAITGTGGLATGTDLDPASVCLVADATTTPSTGCVTSLTTADGTWTVDTTTGVITYTSTGSTPGTQQPVTYRVTDVAGQSVTDTLTPIIPKPPAAIDDVKTTPFNTAKVIDVLGNDTPGDASAPLVASTLKLCDTTETAPNCTATKVTVLEGTYEIVNGKVIFTPNNNFSGEVTSIDYVVEDVLGQKATATISISVDAPTPINAVNDTSTGPWNQAQSRNVVSNSVGTSDTASSGADLDPSSVVLSCPTSPPNPDCSTALDSNGKVTVTIAGQGTYSLDPNTPGVVVFTPVLGFYGTADPVTYTVSDNLGQTDTATYTPTVTAPAKPVVRPDTSTGAWNTPQSQTVLVNDTASARNSLDPDSVVLSCTTPVSPKCHTALDINGKVTVTIDGQGTYSLDPTNPGVVIFTPLPTFTGTASPVKYTVSDEYGLSASTTYTPTVSPPPPPVARPDVTSGNKDVNQTVNLVTNPAATGTDAAGIDGVTLDPSTVRLCAIDNPATSRNEAETPPNCTATTLTVPGVGTYTVDATGLMTFDPLPNYTGTPAPIKYIVKDSIGQVANSTYTPTVLAPPTVRPDTTVGPINTAQTINVVTNTVNTGDTANSGATLVLASLAISCPSAPAALLAIAPALATPSAVTCTVGPNGEIIMAGQGTYTIDPENPGSLIFTPEPTFVGTAAGVKYSITDSNGQTSSTTYTPTVLPAPTARDDYSVAEQGATQWISPLGNDSGSAGAKLLPGTVFLCRTGEPPPDCEATEVVIPGQGTFTVSAFGVVKFVPEPGFTGTVTPLNYQVTDALGQKTDATIYVEVLPPPAPSATMDTGSADYNKPVTLKPWLNDFAGTKPDGSSFPAPKLIPSSIRLCTTVTTPPNCNATTVTTVDGTYVVNTKTGEVVFTPVDGFTGTVTAPVTYQISNNWKGSAGRGVTTSILVPTINPPGSPAANVDVTETKPGVSVVLVPVSNDTAGNAPLSPRTIRLCGADEISPLCSQMKVTTLDGTYVVDPKTGNVTFTPRRGFLGTATIPYVISDTTGKISNSNLVITVKDSAEVVPVVHKKKTGLAKTGGHRPDVALLLGILAMVGAGGLRVASRKR